MQETNVKINQKVQDEKKLDFYFNFGPINDDRIASTKSGIVFMEKNKSWYMYDKETCKKTKMKDLKFQHFPMVLFPALHSEIEDGDVILYNNEYYYVKRKELSNFHLISMTTEKEINVYPAVNLMDMEIFTKIFVIKDVSNLKDVSGKSLVKNFEIVINLGMSQNNQLSENYLQHWMPLLILLKSGNTPFSKLYDKIL